MGDAAGEQRDRRAGHQRTLSSARCGRWASRTTTPGGNGLDPSDRDNVGNTGRKEIVNRPVFGMYQPDGIDALPGPGRTYLVTANEGDARDWPGLTEEAACLRPTLEPGRCRRRPQLMTNDLTAFGRLTVTNRLGNTDADPAFESLYAFGARSFSIWSETAGWCTTPATRSSRSRARSSRRCSTPRAAQASTLAATTKGQSPRT